MASITGCGAREPAAPVPESTASAPDTATVAPPAAASPALAAPPSARHAGSPSPSPASAPATGSGVTASTSASLPEASLRAPLVTYAGELDLRVDKDAPASIDAIIRVAESVGGYLGSRNDAAVEVRVPSQRFREALGRIEPLGEVSHQSVTATDVSDEFHDAEVRLQNLRATRARLEELLTHSGTLSDTLAVERELERVSLEIDRIEGRIEYLKSRIAFSSIAVRVTAVHVDPVKGTVARRFVELPVAWLGELGVDRLLTLR